jgi:class 3 adenylate cyclase
MAKSSTSGQVVGATVKVLLVIQPMQCPKCQHDNRDRAKFCRECAAPLTRACESCGAELEPNAKFCDECATPTGASGAHQARMADAADAAGARKVVTVVFADLAGSTALHERVDAESALRLMERYYETLRAVVEKHGGTVVKLLGDGVMAAFGVPQVAEDDAIRAVYAGVAMQAAFRALVGEQTTALAEVGLRISVNTGEVVVSGGHDDIIGDPINIAARLQRAAGHGDVVIGEETHRLVASLVTLESLGSFALTGRSGAVTAYRIVSLERPAGVSATPFVGRDSELARITAVYDAAIATPTARLAVLLGSPGLGKSRLIDELLLRLGTSASIIDAHCDAAGGATFAPLADALRKFLEIEAGVGRDSIHGTIESALATDDSERTRIASGVTSLLAGEPASAEETFFVVRRLLASFAAEKPVVLVIDDLQWAEPLLLDLVEHLIQWGTGAALFVVAGARPELRELRSSLVTPDGLATDVITLEGLDAGAATRLAAHVVGASDLPAAVAAKVLATSEGNPLFVGELVRMLVHEGVLMRDGDRWVIGEGLASFEMPPTIHALLAARIERLSPRDRTILERAAVIGRQFSRGAVSELMPGGVDDLDARLEALRRSELIERDTGWFLGEPAMRFHHVLIRDAAYRRLLKETRIELHTRIADWIEARAGESVEYDEAIGLHLEQAHQLLGELGTFDEAGRALGERAAQRLAAAGRRSLARDDVSLAANLLGRALDRLDKTDPVRADLALDACEAQLAAGDVGAAAPVIEELDGFAARSKRLRAWHTCFVGQLTALTAPEELHATADAVATAAEQLATLDDTAGEAKAHFVHAQALARLGKVGACDGTQRGRSPPCQRRPRRRTARRAVGTEPRYTRERPLPRRRASAAHHARGASRRIGRALLPGRTRSVARSHRRRAPHDRVVAQDGRRARHFPPSVRGRRLRRAH